MWREHYSWTVTELARRAGLTKGYISEIERSRIVNPHREQLAKLASGLSLTEWDLIARTLPEEAAKQPGRSAGGRATFSAPVTVDQPRDLDVPFEARIADIMVEYQLSYDQRRRARKLILATAESICRVLKQEAQP